MVRLELRHLAMIQAVAESRTLSEAAGKLQITPSALSHRIKEAERRIGRKLLERGTDRPRLSETGVLLLPVATRCLRELAEIERGSVAEQPSIPAVRIAASTISGYQWLPGLMKATANLDEPVEVEVAGDVSLDPVGALRAGSVDVAVVPVAVRDEEFRCTAIFRDEMVAVLPPGHPKARRKWLDARDFLDEPYVTDATRPEAGREIERFFRPSGVQPSDVRSAGATEGVLTLVAAGLGLTILTRLSVLPYLGLAPLELRPLGPRGLRVDWHAVYRRGSHVQGAPVARVVDELKRVGAEVEGRVDLCVGARRPGRSRAKGTFG